MKTLSFLSKISIAALCALAAGLCVASETELPAELAIRWTPSSGGPKSTDEVVKILSLDKPPPKKTYQVEYFDIERPDDARPDMQVIARKRIKEDSKKRQLMIKYRGYSSLSEHIDTKQWDCPLKPTSGDGEKPEIKYETDISVAPDNQLYRVHSLSCAVEGKDSIQFPPKLKARPKGQAKKMARMEIGSIKIDEWTEDGKDLLIEVSMDGRDAGSSIDLFNKTVSYPLISSGAIPIAKNKSE